MTRYAGQEDISSSQYNRRVYHRAVGVPGFAVKAPWLPNGRSKPIRPARQRKRSKLRGAADRGGARSGSATIPRGGSSRRPGAGAYGGPTRYRGARCAVSRRRRRARDRSKRTAKKRPLSRWRPPPREKSWPRARSNIVKRSKRNAHAATALARELATAQRENEKQAAQLKASGRNSAAQAGGSGEERTIARRGARKSGRSRAGGRRRTKSWPRAPSNIVRRSKRNARAAPHWRANLRPRSGKMRSRRRC